jgi:ribosomal protein S18 acetylase RimI-like enzyme
MTATEPGVATRPGPEAGAELERALTVDSQGRPDFARQLAHQFPLDAIDRSDYARLRVWPPRQPGAAILHAAGGTLMPAGDPAAAEALAAAVEQSGWRALVGPAELGEGILEWLGRGLFRRRVASRQQRFMVATEPVDVPPLGGLRLARHDDLEALTDMACQLHVEDRMGPPISRSGRASVRARLRHSISRQSTWVVESRGQAVAKVDLALCSPRRGAQIAGVYVCPAWRAQGLAAAAVAAITARLLADGLLGVTLHVRADNERARGAYERAGFVDRGAWTLAIH